MAERDNIDMETGKDTSAAVEFLLVIPAYQESGRLPAYLEALAAELQEQEFQTRILVVDDGSGREEQEALAGVVATLSKRFPIILPPLLLEVNLGKGGSIMAGWALPTPALWLGFVDADGATPASEVARLLRIADRQRPDRVSLFASRVKLMGRLVERKTSRHLMGRVYATLVGSLIHPGVYDSQCGCKILPAEVVRAIRDRVTEKRFAFDVDLLAALVDEGYPIEEVPISWRDVPGSKVSFVKDTIRMFVSLLRIRRKRKAQRAAKCLEKVAFAIR